MRLLPLLPADLLPPRAQGQRRGPLVLWRPAAPPRASSCAPTALLARLDPDPSFHLTPRPKKVFGAVNLALILSAIGYLPGFVNAVGGLQTALGGFVAVFSNTAAIMGATAPTAPFQFAKLDGTVVTVNSVQLSLQNAQTDVSKMSEIFGQQRASTADTRVHTALDLAAASLPTLNDLLAGAKTSSVTIASGLQSTADALSAPIDSVPWTQIKTLLNIAGLVVLAIIVRLSQIAQTNSSRAPPVLRTSTLTAPAPRDS